MVPSYSQTFALNQLSDLELRNLEAELVTHHGRQAVRLVEQGEPAEQPCLIVNDLKLGETSGRIALWIGAGPEAYFSRVTVK